MNVKQPVTTVVAALPALAIHVAEEDAVPRPELYAYQPAYGPPT